MGEGTVTRRRLLLAGAVWPALAFGQMPAKRARLGYLVFGGPSQRLHEAFRDGLGEFGYVDGQNITVEYRFARGSMSRLQAFAEELARLPVDVIVAPDPPSFHAAMRATSTIPIVMRTSTDPVASGAVASFARPGGNVTGMFSFYSELNGKRMELLKETLPATSRVMILFDSGDADAKKGLAAVEAAAKPLNLRLLPRDVHRAAELENAFRTAVRDGANGLLVLRSPLFVTYTAQIADLATKSRLPGVYDDLPYVEAGGLMSYGADLRALYRHTASYVDRILKGAKAADLPIEQPSKLDLVINLRSAKALGVKIPQSILLRADKVIE